MFRTNDLMWMELFSYYCIIIIIMWWWVRVVLQFSDVSFLLQQFSTQYKSCWIGCLRTAELWTLKLDREGRKTIPAIFSAKQYSNCLFV